MHHCTCSGSHTIYNGMQQQHIITMIAKILIVDDNEAMAEYFSDFLTYNGYTTTVFNCSQKALDYCKTNLHQYNLVISDVCMPNMTGDQLAKELLSLDSNLPIILCSGYMDHISKEQLLNMGIKHFMEKPINNSKLLTILGELNLC